MMLVVNQDPVANNLSSVSEDKMQDGDNAERKWREKSIEGDDALRTVECLRGRLLAERTSSRAAKEEAELMRIKLLELERQVKAEIEAKNRTEKKLRFLTKRLKSLKLSPVSDQMSSSETSSGLKGPEEEKSDPETAVSIKCNREEETMERKEASTSPDPSHHVSVTGASNANQMQWSEGSSGSVITDPEELDKVDYNTSSKDDLSLRDSSKGSENGDSDPSSEMDNSLAIVPVSTPTSPKQSRESTQIIKSDDVREVLSALRHAKEKLQSYMGTRDGNHGFQCRSVELCGGV